MCAAILMQLTAKPYAQSFEMNVDVIEQRPETLTALGATKAAYKHENPKDSHHANAKFGILMFQDLMAYGEKGGFL